MPRPKAFERADVLLKAKMVFWEKGFGGTTTDDLRLAMGIGRQSFYDTFKSKHELFVEVLANYNADRVASLAALVDKSRSPLSALEAVLNGIAAEDAKFRALGCIGVSSVCEFGTNDAEIAAANHRAGERWREVLEELIGEGKAAREIRASVDEKAAARYLLALSMGMRVSARGGMKPGELRAIAKVAIEGLRV